MLFDIPAVTIVTARLYQALDIPYLPPVSVVPFQDVNPLALDKVHRLASLRDKGGECVERIALFHIEGGGQLCRKTVLFEFH